MQRGTRRAGRWVLPAAVAWTLLGSTARAQDSVIAACGGQGRCTFARVYTVTLQGKDSVKTVAPAAANDAQRLRKGRTVRLASVFGLYREPQSGHVRILGPDLEPGDVAVPSKLPQGAATASAALAGAVFEYTTQPKSKAKVQLPADQLVVLLKGPGAEGAVVEFMKREMRADVPHPQRAEILAGALSFAAGSPELRVWREQLRAEMRQSLDAFRNGNVDPTRLEATLDKGLVAMRVYRLVATEGEEETALQNDLTSEHRRLLERYAIAGALRRAGEHDAFLDKLNQLRLARWSRPDLVAGIDDSLRASAQAHLELATQLLADKQYDRAFDEARIAHGRAPCDEKTRRFYDTTRVEFVSRNTRPVSPEYEGEHKNELEQIVREIQGIRTSEGLSPEDIEYVRKRIVDGETLDADYLPLQLKKAEFLTNLGEFTEARNVVTRIERTVEMGPRIAGQWLQLDATLTRELAAQEKRRQQVSDLTRQQRYKEAIDAAAVGLRADPRDKRLLYQSAIASAVLRRQQQTKAYVEKYLDTLVLDCASTPEAEKTLLELYRRPEPALGSPRAAGSTPNWMSGEYYTAGEVFYDPLSGSFQPRVTVSATQEGERLTRTEINWDGFMATSITTSAAARRGEPTVRDRTALVLEPMYDQTRLYMTGIGGKANSAGERRLLPLRYLNCPDFDPVLAARFSDNVSMRGWSGNPFFHPFLWDGIYLFELVYDDLGRIRTATPVPPDASRPSSAFSEPLTFIWDGSSTRLLAIKGTRYLRELKYDELGRLREERIAYQPDGEGKIEYRYEGDGMRLLQATCEDNFYDRANRVVFLDEHRR